MQRVESVEHSNISDMKTNNSNESDSDSNHSNEDNDDGIEIEGDIFDFFGVENDNKSSKKKKSKQKKAKLNQNSADSPAAAGHHRKGSSLANAMSRMLPRSVTDRRLPNLGGFDKNAPPLNRRGSANQDGGNSYSSNDGASGGLQRAGTDMRGLQHKRQGSFLQLFASGVAQAVPGFKKSLVLCICLFAICFFRVFLYFFFCFICKQFLSF